VPHQHHKDIRNICILRPCGQTIKILVLQQFMSFFVLFIS